MNSYIVERSRSKERNVVNERTLELKENISMMYANKVKFKRREFLQMGVMMKILEKIPSFFKKPKILSAQKAFSRGMPI